MDVVNIPAVLFLLVVAGLLGALIHGAVVESRHDCFPHDPENCRDTTGETR